MRPCGRTGAPLALVLVTLVLTPLGVGGTTLAYPVSSLGLDGVVVPVRFSPGDSGTTTVGEDETTAETTVTGTGSLTVVTSMLEVESATSETQTTSIRLADVSDLSRIGQAQITLEGTTQVSIVAGLVVQTEGAGVPLLSGAPLTVGGTLKLDKGQSAQLDLDVRSMDARGIVLTERWVLVMSR